MSTTVKIRKNRRVLRFAGREEVLAPRNAGALDNEGWCVRVVRVTFCCGSSAFSEDGVTRCEKCLGEVSDDLLQDPVGPFVALTREPTARKHTYGWVKGQQTRHAV